MQTRAILGAFILSLLGLAGIAASSTLGETTTDAASSSSSATTTVTTSPALPADLPLASFRTKRRSARGALHTRRVALCRDHAQAHFRVWARFIRPDRRAENLAGWRARRDHARELSSKCLPTTPVGVGRYLAAKLYGWTSANGQWPHLFALWNRESGWQPCRHYPSTTDCNYAGPSACGIPQFVPCSKLLEGCGTTLGTCSVWTQVKRGLAYIAGSRYGTPAIADAFQMAHGYY